MPALIRAFEEFPDWQIATYLKAACPFSTEPVSSEPAYRDSCSQWNEKVKDTLIANPPDAVFLPGTRTSRQETGMPERVPQGYRDQWLPLVEAGIQIIVIRDTPRFSFDVPRCVFQRGQASRRCTVERHQVLATQNPMYTLPERDLLYMVDLSDELCNDSLCEPVIGNLLVYRDAGHVSPAYMTTLSETLRRALAPILQK
jgi:hypothetical protein